MRSFRTTLRLALPIASALALALPAHADVKDGVDAWQAGDFAKAVAEWRPLALAGDADAQFNLGQAYKLGRGVPVDLVQAESWYRRAAKQGHLQAEDNLGLVIFTAGRQKEAMPYIIRSAERGEPRAQYVLGTALFNGDLIAKDWPRSYSVPAPRSPTRRPHRRFVPPACRPPNRAPAMRRHRSSNRIHPPRTRPRRGMPPPPQAKRPPMQSPRPPPPNRGRAMLRRRWRARCRQPRPRLRRPSVSASNRRRRPMPRPSPRRCAPQPPGLGACNSAPLRSMAMRRNCGRRWRANIPPSRPRPPPMSRRGRSRAFTPPALRLAPTPRAFALRSRRADRPASSSTNSRRRGRPASRYLNSLQGSRLIAGGVQRPSRAARSGR